MVTQKHLGKKYQPQWSYATKTEARKDLNWQKRMNPSTYKWLMKKDIKISGQRVPAKNIHAVRKRKPRPRNILDML